MKTQDSHIRTEEFSVAPERYELAHDSRPRITRRDLFKFAGCGLAVLSLLPDALAQEAGGGRRGGFRQPLPQDIGAWLLVGADGLVTGFTGKVEVGQNARTSLTEVIAEELRVPMTAVTMVMGDTSRCPFDMGTFGSRTTPTMVPQIRRAAAAAREVLLDLAAAQLQVDRATLSAEGGRISAAGGRSIGYGQLTAGKRLTKVISSEVPVTPPAEWKIEGKPHHKVNGRELVTGAHKYVSDLSVPGMQFGAVVRPSAFDAKLVSMDGSAAERMPGVKVVHEGDFVGVTAPSYRGATLAAAAVTTKWSAPQQISNRELFQYLRTHPDEERTDTSSGQPAPDSEVEQAIVSADVRLHATYTVAYIAHCPLEPRATVAQWVGDHLTVWTGTQRPFGVRGELASAFGLPESQIHVMMPDTGSGYGGKHTGECAIEAARLAKATGKPVKLVWSREEEFTWAYFRPAGVIEVASGAKSDGTVTGWDFHNYNSGGSAVESHYNIAAQRSQFHPTKYPLRQGSYRGLAATANHFAREVHMDEMAQAVKMDPLAFRLKNLTDPRLIAVLKAAAERFGWTGSASKPGRGVGISVGVEKGGYIACCAEVEADPAGRALHVARVVEAFDCGAIINPDQLRNQIEGAIVMGIGGALREQIEFENGRITNPHFSQYRVPRFADAPEIEVVLVDRRDEPSAGAGETPIVGIAPAISNAIFNATGVRHRSMPINRDS